MRSTINTNKASRRNIVFAYLDASEGKPTLSQFLKTHRMTKPTFYRFEGEYKAQKSSISKGEKEAQKQRLKETVNDAWSRIEGKEPQRRRNHDGIDITIISDEEKLALARKVYKDAMVSDASAKEKDLAVRMLGMLIEKQKDIREIDGSVIARAAIRAKRELGEQGYGMVEMSRELSILPPELCEDTRQGSGEND